MDIQHCLIIVGIEDAPEARQVENEKLEIQRKKKLENEKLLLEKQFDKAREEYRDSTLYFAMWGSKRHLKTPEEIENCLAMIDSEPKKREVMYENIDIRYKGQGIKDFHHPKSKNGKTFTSEELATHVKEKLVLEQAMIQSGEIPLNRPHH